MPLILDHNYEVMSNMDIDDLFGDGHNLSLPTRPPPRQLYQQIESFRTRSCCQALAWSKLGCIASTASDGFGLALHNLRCNPCTGDWELASFPVPAQVEQGLDGVCIRHLVWSPNGCDLAVIDHNGRTIVLSILDNTLNRPSIYRPAQYDPNDDLHAIVATHWTPLVPMSKQAPLIYTKATKTDEGWRFDSIPSTSQGPSYPNPQRSALVTLSTNGLLKLLYYQADRKWHEASLEIKSIVSSDELIMHATICADKAHTVLVAYATASQQVSVVKVTINFNIVNGNNQQAQQVSVSMAMQHIVTEASIRTSAQEAGSLQTSNTSLSILQIVPGTSHPASSPTIMAVRHILPPLTSQFNHDIVTVIDVWDIVDDSRTSHVAFSRLPTRGSIVSADLGTVPYLKKLDSIQLSKVLVGIEYMAIERVIAFGSSDGSIEYRDRWSMAELHTIGSIDQFSHLSQVGFHMEKDDHCLQFALSPTSCSAVRMNIDGKISWKGLSYHGGLVVEPINTVHYEAVVAGFVLVAANSFVWTNNYDDLLAMARKTISMPDFTDKWIDQLSRTIDLSVDFTEEPANANVSPNPRMQLCFSIINSLGSHGNNKSRDFAALLAWTNLQIRACLNIMTMAVNLRIPVDATRKITMLEYPESARMLTGSIRWALDMMSYIVDCLLHPEPLNLFGQLIKDPHSNNCMEEVNKALMKSKNIGMHLLLCSTSRTYLTAMCRSVVHIDFLARRAIAAYGTKDRDASESTPSDQAALRLLSVYNNIANLTSSSPVPVKKFEELLGATNIAVKDAYMIAGLSSVPAPGQPPNMTNSHHEKRGKLEQMMLYGRDLPIELQPAMLTIMNDTLIKLQREIDQQKLFCYDFSILKIHPSHIAPRSRGLLGLTCNFLRTPLGKFPLSPEILSTNVENPKERRYRRCVRCATVMEDIVSRNPFLLMLLSNARKCACGGVWMSMIEHELINNGRG